MRNRWRENVSKKRRTRGNPHLTIDGDRDGDPHWSTGLSPQGPNEEQKERELEQGNQDHEGCAHPLIQGDWSNESSPRPAELGLNEHVIKPDSLNVADMGTIWAVIDNGTGTCFLCMYWLFGILVCLEAHLPRPGGRGEELELSTGQETLTALRDGEGEGVRGVEGYREEGRSGNFYKLIKKKTEKKEKKRDILIEKAFMWFARNLTLEKCPGIYKDDPS